MFGAYWNYCQISDGVLYYTGLRPTENEVYSMNKTFKIVFNKARGTLMVANELTSSVQKKGVSLVVATAAVLTFLTVPAVNAANIADQTFENQTTSTSDGTGALTLNKDNANTISGSTFKKNTADKKGGAVVIEKDTVITKSTFDSNIQTSTAKDTAGGAVFIDGAKVEISGSSFTQNTGFLGGAVNVRNGSTLSITDSVFSGNSANGFGGAISDYEDKEGAVQNELISINRTVFKNNRDSKGGGALHVVNTKAINITDSEFSGNFSAGKGGAIQLENGSQLAVTDTVFNGNSTNYWGGAIRVLGADATISATKDISMTGNKANVNGLMSAYYSDMGGFAYLQGKNSQGKNSKLTLAGENGATLTIGDANAVDKTIDSIASLGGHEPSANELILKGNVVINSSLEAFSDKITVADNANVTMATGFASDRISLQADINQYGDEAWDDYGTSELSLGDKASLTMGDLVINRAGYTGENGVKKYGNPGVKITAGQNSTLNLKSLSIVTKKYLSKGKDTNVTTTGYGLFHLNDAAVNVAGDVTLAEKTRLDLMGSGNFDVNGKVNVAGQMTASGTQDGTLKLSINDLSINGGSLTIGDNATLVAPLAVAFTGNPTLESKSLTLLTGLSFTDNSAICITDRGTYNTTFLDTLKTASNAGGVSLPNGTLALDDDNTTISTDVTTGAISGGKSIGIVPGKSLTISGNGETSSIGTLTLASMDTRSAAFIANNNTTVKVNTLSGTGRVSVGEHNGTNAHMSINKLDMRGGSIFIDPYYGESTLAVASLSGGELNTNVTAGTGALVAFVTDVASAKNAVAKLDGFSALQSVVYVGTSMTLGTSGSIVIKPLATAADETHAKKVYVASNGGLVIDQSAVGSNTVFAGAEKVTFEEGGKLGITNATVGTITLTDAEETVVEGITTATTDNPFVEAAVDGNTVVNTMSAEGGLGALASTGIQAMTRRADTVLAQTIADRTSVAQELAAGTNLWVDVTGERYEADKLDNGGEFKSDMGYGAFGADFAVTQDITAGAAFQYGKGSLRSGVSSIKNSIDSYGVTAYGAMKFGEAQVVAEASYIKNENDITSSQTALNQSVDSEIYSVGVRGQHRFTAGNFQFVPSVGVRVSRLNTDAMQVGAVNIKKQEQTLVQVPIALRVNGFEQNVSGWSVAPSFKIAYVPTFGDKEISVFGADQTVIDTSPVQGDFGIRAQNGNLMVNANMMLGGGKDGTSSVGGKVGLKYVF